MDLTISIPEAVDLNPDCYAAYVARAYLIMQKDEKPSTEDQTFN